MSKKNPNVLGPFSMDGLPKELKEGMKAILKDLIEDDEKATLKPLVTISQKDVIKQQRISARRDAVKAVMEAMLKILDETSKELSDWWDMIEDKYEIGHDKELKLTPETGLICERVKKEGPIGIVKDDGPLN